MTVEELNIRPGERVRDKISLLEGVVKARTEWDYGCVRITLQPDGSKDGKPFETFTIDEPQCERIEAPVVPQSGALRGGDRPEPVRNQDLV